MSTSWLLSERAPHQDHGWLDISILKKSCPRSLGDGSISLSARMLSAARTISDASTSYVPRNPFMSRDESWLLDMLAHAKKARERVSGVAREEFISDVDKQLAVTYLIMIVGEAAA